MDILSYYKDSDSYVRNMEQYRKTSPNSIDEMQEPEIVFHIGVPRDFVPMEPRAQIILNGKAYIELVRKGFTHFSTAKSREIPTQRYYFFANTPELEAELAANYVAERDYFEGGI